LRIDGENAEDIEDGKEKKEARRRFDEFAL
jgi:hypothetical protein